MYRQKHRKPKNFNFDLIVIGSGAGGAIAAQHAAEAGKKVAMVEADKLGGESLNHACLPSKALLHAAAVYDSAKESTRFGVRSASVTFNYRSVSASKDKAVVHAGHDETASAFRHEHITVLRGRAHFIDPWNISLSGQRFSAKNFLIAAGASPRIPEIEGLRSAGFLTHREATSLNQPPRSIFIIGGGDVGVEFAQLFNSFGSRVVLAESGPRILPREDREVGALLKLLLERRGVSIHTATRVLSISVSGGRKTVKFEVGGKEQSVSVEEILVAVGRMPNVDLGLDNTGVRYSSKGILVNQYQQTNVEHIFAAGDVTGEPMFTHTAMEAGKVAAYNISHKKKVRRNNNIVTRCVYSNPEVACVGMTEDLISAKRIPYQKSAVPLKVLARSDVEKQPAGFVKILASHTGVILGASVVAPHATEMIHELTLAIQHSMKASAVSQVTHAFPTWSQAIQIACSKIDCL